MDKKVVWRRSPLLIFAMGALAESRQVWGIAMRLAFRAMARRPRLSTEALDATFSAHEEQLQRLSSELYQERRRLVDAFYQAPEQSTLPTAVEQARVLAETFTERAIQLAAVAETVCSASLLCPEGYPDREGLSGDLQRLTEALKMAQRGVDEAMQHLGGAETILRNQAAETAGRLGLSKDEAIRVVTGRWRDPE